MVKTRKVFHTLFGRWRQNCVQEIQSELLAGGGDVRSIGARAGKGRDVLRREREEIVAAFSANWAALKRNEFHLLGRFEIFLVQGSKDKRLPGSKERN